MPRQPELIVFFDGVCHLCNAFVDFLIQKETEGRLVFAPLQGENAKKYLSENDRVQLQTIVVYNLKSGEILRESAAVFKAISKATGWLGTFSIIGTKIPSRARDLLYRIVAKNRYTLFGKKDVCRIPDASERSRLWD